MTDPKMLESIGFAEKTDEAFKGDVLVGSLVEGWTILGDGRLERAVIDAAIAWRYQAHSQNKVDDALWESVDALLKARQAK